MKFTCNSCGAAYIISDEKVGPNGVRVRCKKCGNQITVRRVEPAPAAPVLERTGPVAAPGLDEELGNAFDHAFGDQPAASTSASAPAPAPEPAPAVADSPAPAAAPIPAAPDPAAQEWYVAIGEAQVGPLQLLEVKKRWEAGEIGPDSLVWRPGMAEWAPLSGVPELAAFLAPVPQPSEPAAAPAAAVFASPTPRQDASTQRSETPAPELEWKPTGASALADLANEEMASRAPAVAEKPVARRSVMEQLPDSGGVDPTGAIPLPIKAMERTGERPVHRSSVARGAEEVRHKRTVRTVVLVASMAVIAVVASAIAYVQLSGHAAPPAAVAVQPAGPAVAALPPAPPAPVPAPATANTLATPATANAINAPLDPVAPAPAAKLEPAEPRPSEKVAEAPPPRKARPPPAVRPVRPAAAAAAPVARPPVERPAAKKKDGLLDFDQGGDDDLAAALGSGAGGRKVYVPPAAGAATPAPDRLSDGQILESVKLHSEELRRCVSEQQAREPGVKGTIRMAWLIQADGTTRDVRCLTPEYAQGDFARCMTGVVRGIRFPSVGDPKGQNVTFPFTF